MIDRKGKNGVLKQRSKLLRRGNTVVHPSSSDVTALQQRLDELSALNTLTKTLLSQLSIDSVIQAVYEQVDSVLHPDLSVLYFREHDHLVLQSSGARRQGFPEVKLVGQCLCGTAVATGKAVYSKDILTDPLCTLEECKAAGMASFAVAS